MLQIYNTLTRRKEPFQPITPGKVRMYVCGMTVYDYCHLGHARVMVSFDVIARFLRAEGFELTYVRNITDIDDKIINRANEQSIPIEQLTDRFIQAMHEDERALGVLAPDVEPRATEFIDKIILMIQRLIDNGYAYQADNGDVYYDVSRFASYGQLSQKDLQGLQAGARVTVDSDKRSANDFVLWKSAKPEEPHWGSPWGVGRPGWHIECSVMATHCLGDHFDIHGGGLDLQFPHHENEIAQSEGATGEHFVNTWMHIGFLQINTEKMSKSLGNFFTIREVLKTYRAEVIRYFLISSHYRSPLNYSQDNLDSAEAALNRVYTSLRGLPLVSETIDDAEYEKRFRAAMHDDFNTQDALAVLFELVSAINLARQNQEEKAAHYAALLRKLAFQIGLFQTEADTFLQAGVVIDSAYIEDLIMQRKQARVEKNFKRADEIRDELHAKSIELEDTANGTIWRKR